MTSIAWFRRDLRLEDNPAWSAACADGPVVAVFVLEPGLLAATGTPRQDLFLGAVHSLATELRDAGGTLHILAGPATSAIPAAVAAVKPTSVHCNADPSPFARHRDAAVTEVVGERLQQHWGNSVHAPGTVLTQKGTLSQVFTPFSKRWAATPIDPVADARPVFADADLSTVSLPHPAGTVDAGSDAAHRRLVAFAEVVDDYPELRDIPSVDGTSMLSADLHMGTIGPRAVIDVVGTHSPGREAFVRQLAWRDWYTHLLVRTPTMLDAALRSQYDAIEWRDDETQFEAWRTGHTGYPLVDAGMRQPLETGWMHNRVRMVTASFLVKHLLIDWRRGERWFRHQLIDGDVAQNAGNWQWVAGTGPDAAPYFRVFNPIAQSQKFDGDGSYIRRWVPELAGLDHGTIHAPWEAGPLELASAGVVLDDTYPSPIVDHREARERCLAAYKRALG